MTLAEPAGEDAQLRLMQVYAALGQPARALRQFQRCREVLQSELDAVPGPALEEYAVTIRAEIAAVSPVVLPAKLPLPPVPVPPTPLVGRGREVEALHDLLAEPASRLITLTGPTGVGKTRLAQEVALTTDAFPEGVVFIPLADFRAPALVAVTIARATGAGDKATRDHLAAIQQVVGDRQVLLVLDNFEQLVPAAGNLAALLDCCPYLNLLVTSRTPLHIQGEEIVAVETLPVPPDSGRLTHRILLRYPAAELFLERLLAVRPDFTPSDEMAPTIGAICRCLDGLPLALELAAARGRHLSLGALFARLSHRLDLLTGGPRDLPAHQQTLRATLAWRYDALAPLEQTVFRRLAVCAGGFTEETATWLMREVEFVPADPPSVRTAIERLIENNLVRVEPGEHEPRFDMLETMREFGQDQLRLAGEAEETLAAHPAWMLALAERFYVPGSAATPPDVLDRLELEHENLRAALDWLLTSGEGDTALRLCLATRDFGGFVGFSVKAPLGSNAVWIKPPVR